MDKEDTISVSGVYVEAVDCANMFTKEEREEMQARFAKHIHESIDQMLMDTLYKSFVESLPSAYKVNSF